MAQCKSDPAERPVMQVLVFTSLKRLNLARPPSQPLSPCLYRRNLAVDSLWAALSQTFALLALRRHAVRALCGHQAAPRSSSHLSPKAPCARFVATMQHRRR